MLETAFALEVTAAFRNAAIAATAGIPQDAADFCDAALCDLYAAGGAIGHSAAEIDAIARRHVSFDAAGRPWPLPIDAGNVVKLRG